MGAVTHRGDQLFLVTPHKDDEHSVTPLYNIGCHGGTLRRAAPEADQPRSLRSLRGLGSIDLTRAREEQIACRLSTEGSSKSYETPKKDRSGLGKE